MHVVPPRQQAAAERLQAAEQRSQQEDAEDDAREQAAKDAAAAAEAAERAEQERKQVSRQRDGQCWMLRAQCILAPDCWGCCCRLRRRQSWLQKQLQQRQRPWPPRKQKPRRSEGAEQKKAGQTSNL